MDGKLPSWINEEIKRRGWSHRELARRANVSGAMVSAVISGEKKAGWDFCAAIAKPLGKTPEEMFRLAGLLTDFPPEDATLRELNEFARRLTPEQRFEVLQYAQFRWRREEMRQQLIEQRKHDNHWPTPDEWRGIIDSLSLEERKNLVEYLLQALHDEGEIEIRPKEQGRANSREVGSVTEKEQTG